MKDEAMPMKKYVLNLDKSELNTVIQSLAAKKRGREAEDLSTETIDAMLDRISDTPAQRRFCLGSPKFELFVSKAERYELIRAVTEYRSDLLSAGKIADVAGDVLQKVLFAKAREVEHAAR